MHFGKYLRTLRKKNKVSRKVLSAVTGISISAIRDLECDETYNTSWKTICQLFKYFGYVPVLAIDAEYEITELDNNLDDELDEYDNDFSRKC